MSNHTRRSGYWRQYHLAHTLELDALVGGIVSLVKEGGPPDEDKRTSRRRGRRPVHSPEKLVAVLDHLVVLRAMVTDYRVQGSPALRRILAGLPPMPGCVFNADRGYDAEANFERVYALKMRPNIKQRRHLNIWGGRTPHKKLFSRIRAAKEFDLSLYKWRGMIEAIFGAEESGGHRLRTRFRTEGSRERWGPTMAIGWNLKVLNRLRCARSLGTEVMPLVGN